MNRSGILIAALLALGVAIAALAWSDYQGQQPRPVTPEPWQPCPGPGPCPLPAPKPQPKPWGDLLVGEKAVRGGPVGPGGIEVTCDLPVSLRHKNVGGRDGSGLCVFDSITFAACFQNEQAAKGLFDAMKKEPGGGYPAKVDAMMAKYCKGAPYLQYEGGDPSILDAAIRSGRMPAITYGFCEQYGGRVAHMTNLVYLDDKVACVLDNNFVGDNELEWMSREEFLRRWKMGGGGWAIVLLQPAPAPIPHN